VTVAGWDAWTTFGGVEGTSMVTVRVGSSGVETATATGGREIEVCAGE